MIRDTSRDCGSCLGVLAKAAAAAAAAAALFAAALLPRPRPPLDAMPTVAPAIGLPNEVLLLSTGEVNDAPETDDREWLLSMLILLVVVCFFNAASSRNCFSLILVRQAYKKSTFESNKSTQQATYRSRALT